MCVFVNECKNGSMNEKGRNLFGKVGRREKTDVMNYQQK